jgi:hypothetical protein
MLLPALPKGKVIREVDVKKYQEIQELKLKERKDYV